MTSFKMIVAAALVALLVPVAAVAKDAPVSGPAKLVGKGFFGGEFTMAATENQRPVRIAARAGYVGILDLGGDLKVRCTGNGRVTRKQTERGAVYLCAGPGGVAVVLGSHFTFRGHAAAYHVLLPAGVRGTFHGRFVQCRPADANCGQAQRPARERTEKPAPAEEEEELPTLSELAEMLVGK